MTAEWRTAERRVFSDDGLCGVISYISLNVKKRLFFYKKSWKFTLHCRVNIRKDVLSWNSGETYKRKWISPGFARADIQIPNILRQIAERFPKQFHRAIPHALIYFTKRNETYLASENKKKCWAYSCKINIQINLFLQIFAHVKFDIKTVLTQNSYHIKKFIQEILVK